MIKLSDKSKRLIATGLFIIATAVIFWLVQRSQANKPAIKYDELSGETISTIETGGSDGHNSDDKEVIGIYRLLELGIDKQDYDQIRQQVNQRLRQQAPQSKLWRLDKKSLTSRWGNEQHDYMLYEFNVYYTNRDFLKITVTKYLDDDKIKLDFK